MKTTLAVLVLLLAGCKEVGAGPVVGEVYGTYVVCVDPASKPFQVAIKSGTRIAVGDPCPDGERR